MTASSHSAGRAPLRCVLLMVHLRRTDAVHVAADLAEQLLAMAVRVRLLREGPTLPPEVTGRCEVVASEPEAAAGCDLVISVGGDGTLLHAAEFSRPHDIPLLGINVGRVGFLADTEVDQLPRVLAQAVAGSFDVELRDTLAVRVERDGVVLADTWALNEMSLEKGSRERILEVQVKIDGRPLAQWGCDGLICATPTGSTAYAFSAGGPVVWPEVAALVVVPISAHALYARPMVINPASEVLTRVVAPTDVGGVLWCDGRRSVDVPAGAHVRVKRSDRPVHLARLVAGPFTDRLVAKFCLPVDGWHGARTSD